jgi:hypothetical protein
VALEASIVSRKGEATLFSPSRRVLIYPVIYYPCQDAIEVEQVQIRQAGVPRIRSSYPPGAGCIALLALPHRHTHFFTRDEKVRILSSGGGRFKRKGSTECRGWRGTRRTAVS